MNAGKTPVVGIIDALTAGLILAARRPWLILIPALVDLFVWLGPRLSVGNLLSRWVLAWEALLPLVYEPAQIAGMRDGLDLLETTVVQVGDQLNLAGLLTAGWLAPPSALATAQASRLTLISDGVLAPSGFALSLPRIVAPAWQPAAIELSSLWVALAVAVAVWCVGQVLVAIYLRYAAVVYRASGSDTALGARPGFLLLTVRIAALTLVLGIAVFVLRLPLAAVTALAVLTGSAGAGIIFVLSGGITLWLTLWFLTALFFAGDAIVLDGQPLWPGLVQSVVLVRRSGWRTLWLATLINLLMLGARALWGMLGDGAVGAVAGILANAYLATAMLMAIFAYYGGLRQQWSLVKGNRPAIR